MRATNESEEVNMSEKVYKRVTEQIINKLEQGEIPWQKPWKASDWPKNITTMKEYSGFNVIVLMSSGYADQYWLTYKQAKSLGGSIKKGEKGFPVIKYMMFDTVDKDSGKEKSIPCIRYYTVFNIEQTEGINLSKDLLKREPLDFNPIDKCEEIVKNYIGKPEIKHVENRAYYSPKLDYVNMPKPERFNSCEDYYRVLFHELGHSTGHESRLDRKLTASHGFGSHEYSKEELVAEFCASFLSAHANIEGNLDNSASYIQSWLKVLKNDSKLVVQAASKAQKASDYILGIKR
jgi:antirestriction protein ArdC